LSGILKCPCCGKGMFENIAFIMAKHADASIPDTPEEWLDQFNTFSMYTVRPFDGRLRTAVD